ncbi:hypothetical protein RHOFW510R12_00575 [Rhodanobacter sp. FW510-R12]
MMAFGGLAFSLAAAVQADGSAIRTITLGRAVSTITGAAPEFVREPQAARSAHVAPPAVKHRPKSRQHRFPEDDPDVRACVTKAAAVFDIDPIPLYLILDVEGGTVGENSRTNRNGTYDIGKAQINSSHLDQLAARGISEEVLRDDLCVNILVQGWLFKDGLVRSKSLAKAIGLYHSPDPALQRIYLEKIDQAIARRVARPAANP